MRESTVIKFLIMCFCAVFFSHKGKKGLFWVRVAVGSSPSEQGRHSSWKRRPVGHIAPESER